MAFNQEQRIPVRRRGASASDHLPLCKAAGTVPREMPKSEQANRPTRHSSSSSCHKVQDKIFCISLASFSPVSLLCLWYIYNFASQQYPHKHLFFQSEAHRLHSPVFIRIKHPVHSSLYSSESPTPHDIHTPCK